MTSDFYDSTSGPPGLPADPSRLAAASLRQTFAPALALVHRVDAVDPCAHERHSLEGVTATLLPLTQGLVRDAREVATEVLRACAPWSQQAPTTAPGLESGMRSFERLMDEAVSASDATVRAVEDTAFLVVLELGQRAERLERTGTASSVLALLGECDSALRRTKKGLAAIEVAIAALDGSSPALGWSSELDKALHVRTAYAWFRRHIRQIDLRQRDAPGTLHPAMRACGTAIAQLVGRDDYAHARVADRLQVRQLQQRILGWLHPEHRHDELAGRRLWQDILAFTEMLTQVNRREELVEHDRNALARAHQELLQPGATDRAIRTAMAPLAGLDDDLDTALESEPLDHGRLLALVGGRRLMIG